MNPFEFSIPQNIIVGAGTLAKLPECAKKMGGTHEMILSGPTLKKMGVVDKAADSLKVAGIAADIFTDIEANPSVTTVEKATESYLASGADFLVALGGGSPMDAAKGAAARVVHPNTPVNKMAGLLKVRHKIPTFVAVPTTAGTGSETTIAAVITDPETHHKYAIMDLCLVPKYAILDPELTRDLPQKTTSTTGMDALTHAIEGYITKGACTISDMFHLEAIRLISENLRGAVQNTEAGREGMALGQYIAGMGFSNVGLGIVHSMAHGLSALYDTPHGVGCAIILPTGLEYNKSVAGERYRAVGKAMGVEGIDAMTAEEAADATIAAVKKLSEDVGIPTNLKGILKEEDVQFLAESAFADACCPGNPRDTSVEEIAGLYRSLM